MKKLLLPLALIVSGLSFPFMLFSKDWIFKWPTPEKFEKGMEPNDWYKRPLHYLKNITTEVVKFDAEWWGKFLLFVLIAHFVLERIF